MPSRLPALAAKYKDMAPEPVRFRPSSWDAALADVPGHPTALLTDPAVTSETSQQRFRALGDRVIARDAVLNACQSIDLDDDQSVASAFVLVMAWGSGTTNGRSLRYIRAALQDPPAAAETLRRSATSLRAIARLEDPALLDVHREFSLPGVGEAFFTKWFAFAGCVPNRDWQPLILDSRVRATLHKTLNVWLNTMTDRRRDAERYVAYLWALHLWSARLTPTVTAMRLEWILFRHNGKDA